MNASASFHMFCVCKVFLLAVADDMLQALSVFHMHAYFQTASYKTE